MIEDIEMQENMLKKIEDFKEILKKKEKLNEEEKRIIFEKYVSLILSGQKLIMKPNKLELTNQPFKNASFVEIVRKTRIKQHPDIILLATYDLIVNKGYESVTTSEILDQYKQALIKPSSNTSADIRRNRGKGYIMSSENKEGKMAFKITISGIDYVEDLLKNAS